MWHVAEEVAVQWNYIIVSFLFDHCLCSLVGMHGDRGVVPLAPVFEHVLARCFGHHVCRCPRLEDSH